MRKEKSLSILLVATLLLSMTAVFAAPVEHHNAWAIWVDPASKVGLHKPDTFVVDVYINASSITYDTTTDKGLYGWEYKLNWDTTKISCIGKVNHIPSIWGANVVIGTDSGGVGASNHWFGVSAKAPAPPWNETSVPWAGAQSVCTYTFRVEYQPYEPDPDYTGSILFTIHKLYGYPSAGMVPHTFHNGAYTIETMPTPLPKLEVIPADIKGTPIGDISLGELFNVSIVIYNLYPQWNLTGWEAKLSYNTSLLDALASYEGPFLPSFQGPNGTIYINHINDPIGLVTTGGAFLDGHSVAHCEGTRGTLALIEFNATAESIAPDIWTCDLDLFDTKLKGYVQNQIIDIDHTINSGTYQAPYRTLGWYLDCFTDAFRKKCETPWLGVGTNYTADAYEPQDLVILYANLTYNEEPEAYKMVTFEVHGPINSVENITIFRTAWTNASGTATINFTIPGSGLPNWQEMVFGKWECYQAAQVKIYQKPTDWIWWEVGWIVEIFDNVTVSVPHPKGVYRGEFIEITVWFKNIMMIEKSGIITITVLDELLDPIQTETKDFTIGPARYAHNPIPSEDYVVITSKIPIYAHVGMATVYVNAFTGVPKNCGCPYCPEITATFWIIKTGS